MKILLVNDYGGATGGAEIQMLTLRRLLRDRGHDARLFSSSAELVTQSPILADYTCYGTTSRAQVVSQVLNISAYQSLRQALQDFQPDVVHVRMFLWQLSPLILPLLKSYPCLYQTAIYKSICPAGTNILPSGQTCQLEPGTACLKQGCLTPQTWVWMMAQRSLWNRWKGVFDRTVALSNGMKKELAQAGISPVNVIYNGVPERPARPPLQTPPTVGYAGRFSAEKGIETLFQAFAQARQQVPAAQLKMAGKGPSEAALRTLAKQLNIEDCITWLGHIPQTELEQQFNSLWVQVVPSLWAEPFGNVTTEAMMRGTAVIASAVGAQPEIIGKEDTKTKAGTLVPPGESANLAAALLPILQQKSLAEAMGAAGRQRAIAEFSETRCVENFLKLYGELKRESLAKEDLVPCVTT
ncbi:MAG: glycosyltransferase family 1 protein [Leptolyngbya foveolarum]|uniref:Glycosyltransferase family 1 protein n=1 Tax=Leptolyngbya foveolarum TaxID=47253 RepID=A0A2W4U332_9CYAN|nr:MAG: glycosyltransferase family 1 protein [Leptolyngbya foveolarum]